MRHIAPRLPRPTTRPLQLDDDFDEDEDNEDEDDDEEEDEEDEEQETWQVASQTRASAKDLPTLDFGQRSAYTGQVFRVQLRAEPAQLAAASRRFSSQAPVTG